MSYHLGNHFPQSIKDFFWEHRDKTHTEEKTSWKESKQPWLKLSIEAPFEEMLAEAKAIEQHFVKHRTEESQGWLSICLHGIANEATSVPEDHGYKSDTPLVWTEASKLCPVTTNYFKNVFPMEKYYRLRFMLVKSGGYIQPHSDNPGINPSYAINISLNNPDECFLLTEKGSVPFEQKGSVFLFNTHYKHCVINNSKNSDRYHMIVHGIWKDSFKELVRTSYEAQNNNS
jgi:hypothetical protein